MGMFNMIWRLYEEKLLQIVMSFSVFTLIYIILKIEEPTGFNSIATIKSKQHSIWLWISLKCRIVLDTPYKQRFLCEQPENGFAFVKEAGIDTRS